MYQDDEIGSEDDSADEGRLPADDSDLKDDSKGASPDSADPPDWLYQTVGLGDQSESESSDSDSDDDMATLVGDSSAPLGGVVFPDWLTSQKRDEGVEPGTEAGADIESDSSFDEFATLVGQSADYESFPEGDSQGVGGESDGSVLDSGVAESMEAAMNGELDDPVFGQDDQQDELEDELKWLEEIAASHDVSDELSFGGDGGVEDLVPLPEDEYIPDWLKEDLDKEPIPASPEPEPISADHFLDFPEVDSESATVEGDEFPDWLSEQTIDETLISNDDSVGDVDWFNQIVSGDETAIDELLAAQGISLDSEEASMSAGMGDEQPMWISELDEEPEPIDETLIGQSFFADDVQSDEAIESEEYGGLELVEEFDPGADAKPEEVPTDPEEAMAWLEQLAEEQSLAGDEISESLEPIEPIDLAGESADEVIGEIAEESLGLAGVPEDPDEAMAWLEQLATEQGAREDELWAFEVDSESPSDDQIFPAEEDEELAAALSAVSDVPLPSDHEEALAWLEELALGAQFEPDIDSAMDDIFEALPDEFAEERELVQAEIMDDVEPSEPAMDMDELQLAAIMAAAEMLDLGTEDEVDSSEGLSEGAIDSEDALLDELIDEMELGAIDETMPGTMISETLAAEDETDVLGRVPIDETLPGNLMLDAALVDADEVEDAGHASIDDTIAGTLVAAAALADELEREDFEPTPTAPAVIDDDISGEFEQVETEAEEDLEADGEDLEWLDSLDEANVTGWLMAEQALLAEEKDAQDDYTLPRIDITSEAVTDTREESASPEQFFSTYQFDDRDIPELASAQSALRRGQLAEAHNAYSALIDSGESLPYIITDLELVTDVTKGQSDFMKLLGDAYSRNGQLQKAIEIYRLALNNL